MKLIASTSFAILATVFIAFATIAHAARTDPASVRAYGTVHGVVIPPFNR